MLSYPSRSYTLKTCSACQTPCIPFAAFTRTLCVATMIFRLRIVVRTFAVLCRFKVPICSLSRAACVYAPIFSSFFFTCTILHFLSLSPFLPFNLISRRGFSRPIPYCPAHISFPELTWSLFMGSLWRRISVGEMAVATHGTWLVNSAESVPPTP